MSQLQLDNINTFRVLYQVSLIMTVTERASEMPLKFVQERAVQPEYYVSYAWGDRTPGGQDRERIVDQLCAAARSAASPFCGVLGLSDPDHIGEIFAMVTDICH